MGNLVIHGGSVQNTIPAASERYVMGSMSITNSDKWIDVIGGKAKAVNNYSALYVSSPNYNMDYLFNTISNYYVDIIYFINQEETITQKNILNGVYESRDTLRQSVENLSAFVTKETPMIITFYLLKNNTEKLNVSGANLLLTNFTRPDGVSGKISSKSTFVLGNNGTAVSANLINLFTNIESEVPGQRGLNQFGVQFLGEEVFSNILPSEGFTYFNQNPGSVKIMNFDRYNKRKLSAFNVCFKNKIAFNINDGSPTSVTYNKSKLLCTFLCQYDFDSNQITILLVTTPDKTKGGSIVGQKITDGNIGYFHVYIFESNIETTSSLCRSVAIEFLSVDAISIPASFGKQTTAVNTFSDITEVKLVSKNKIISLKSAYNRGYDVSNNSRYVILSLLVPFKKYNYNDNNLDVVRIYDDKTCDVYPNALSVQYAKYRLDNRNYKVYYTKLNK
jgi:hypothetical protein